VPHDLPDIALALIVLGAFVFVWRAEGDDPVWRERRRAISPADRARIAASVRSGDLLASQEEIELAAGFARRARRRNRPYAVIYAIRIPLGIALLAAGPDGRLGPLHHLRRAFPSGRRLGTRERTPRRPQPPRGDRPQPRHLIPPEPRRISEDSRVDIFVLIVTVPVVLSMLSMAFGRGADSPTWELRWRALATADRARISAAARSGAELDDPEEAGLAAGFNRRRLRRSAYVEAPAFFIVGAFTALSAAGIGGGVAGSAVALAADGDLSQRRPLAQQASDLAHRRRRAVA
jgi:hypothetical protein